MPVCEISYASGLLAEAQRNRIAVELSALLIEAEELPDNPIARSICQISINETALLYIGGAPSTDAKIVVKIYAFADAYTDAVKADVHRRIAQLFCSHHPATAAQGGRNVWSMILPIEHNGFGVGGVPVSLEMTKKIVASYAKDA